MSVKQPKTTVKQHFWGSQIAFHFFIKHVFLAPQGALVVIAFLITPAFSSNTFCFFLHPGQPLTPVALMPLKLCRKLQD